MASGNSLTLVGNVTRDPEKRVTQSGSSVVQFGLAVPRRFQKDGEWQEEPHFYDVTCWNSLADNVADSVTKGQRVVVFGRLDQRTWETQEGEKRSKHEVVADEVGPSLRWASASVTKNEKGQNSSGSSAPRNSPPPMDEEPF